MNLIVHTDGGSRGNPGLSGIGVLIEDEQGVLAEIGGVLPYATNNEAEYHALLTALQFAVAVEAHSLRVLADSQLMVRQMNGEYAVSNPRIQELHQAAMKLVSKIPQFIIIHIPREENTRADALANAAMDNFKETAHSIMGHTSYRTRERSNGQL